VGMFLGVVLFAMAVLKEPARAWHAYLTSFMYFTDLALGGLFFTCIQHVAKVGWSVNVRRLMESFSAFLPFAAVGAAVLLIGSKYLYIWLDPEVVASDSLLQIKSAYLNLPFFVVRLVVFFGAWLLFSKLIVGNSIKQDADGSEAHTLRNVSLSIGFIAFFAISYSLFTVDTLMSLAPHWYSTIWGIYNFAGLFQSTLATLILFAIYSMKNGWLNGLVNENHLHDLAKFMKGFTVFYAYIAFSQFLLIWYANLPEETIFYLSRIEGGWFGATASLFIFKFAVPFLLLLPKAAKRSPNYLVLVCSIILIMQYVDLHWMVYPNLDSSQWLFGWQEIGPFLFFGGLFLWSVTRFLNLNNLVPIRDPRISESIHHEVTY
jgi:hypothetical protein